jgi:hypothetical protein
MAREKLVVFILVHGTLPDNVRNLVSTADLKDR